MKYKKILLVCPPLLKGRNRLSHFPLVGVGYIAESLIQIGFDVNVLDMNLGYIYNDLVKKINQFNPDLIGFTGMTLAYKDFYKLINSVKNMFPDKKIVAGGAHLSGMREQFLKDCEGLDYGIVLEGEKSIVELCTGIPLNKISGIIYRENGEIKSNPFKNFIQDLDMIPFPKFESFELDKYPLKQIAIITSKGCPYNCIYCSVSASIGKLFRVKSAKSIVSEIEYWYNRGYKNILILDDNFTLINKRVDDICELLEKKDFRDFHIKLTSGIRADKVDRVMLEKLKNVGVDYIAFGVESASNSVLKKIKKGENIEIIEQRIQEASELNLDMDLFFLVGSPGETLSDVKKSIELAKRYPVRRAIFYNLIPFPGTELLDWLLKNNYLIKPLDEVLNNFSYYKNQPCFYTPEMSIEDRKKAFKMGQNTYIAVRRKFIERKLNAPIFVKKFFSYFYAKPSVEEIYVNFRSILWIKEIIKNLFFNH